MNADLIRDWRGTPIQPGQTVIYGGPVGRSIQQVEGLVSGFTKTGRVLVDVIRRSYTTGEKTTVHVGSDRLTVVSALPPTDRPTQVEELARAEERNRNRNSHDLPPYWISGPSNPSGYCGYARNPEAGGPCRTCGRPAEQAADSPCPQD